MISTIVATEELASTEGIKQLEQQPFQRATTAPTSAALSTFHNALPSEGFWIPINVIVNGDGRHSPGTEHTAAVHIGGNQSEDLVLRIDGVDVKYDNLITINGIKFQS